MQNGDDEFLRSVKRLVWLQEEANQKLARIEGALTVIAGILLMAAIFWLFSSPAKFRPAQVFLVVGKLGGDERGRAPNGNVHGGCFELGCCYFWPSTGETGLASGWMAAPTPLFCYSADMQGRGRSYEHRLRNGRIREVRVVRASSAQTKLGHCQFQTRPLGVKTGQYQIESKNRSCS
jgi:hypothetical protein